MLNHGNIRYSESREDGISFMRAYLYHFAYFQLVSFAQKVHLENYHVPV
uniref:Uncharacterized protein n=1 Tax=Arundo donax TaxID=35708 RepID=A0A0A9DRY0_ARUDO